MKENKKQFYFAAGGQAVGVFLKERTLPENTILNDFGADISFQIEISHFGVYKAAAPVAKDWI